MHDGPPAIESCASRSHANGQVVPDYIPTGLLIARPTAAILYAAVAKGPKLAPDHQLNSTRHLMRELNRLGVTTIIDAGVVSKSR